MRKEKTMNDNTAIKKLKMMFALVMTKVKSNSIRLLFDLVFLLPQKQMQRILESVDFSGLVDLPFVTIDIKEDSTRSFDMNIYGFWKSFNFTGKLHSK